MWGNEHTRIIAQIFLLTHFYFGQSLARTRARKEHLRQVIACAPIRARKTFPFRVKAPRRRPGKWAIGDYPESPSLFCRQFRKTTRYIYAKRNETKTIGSRNETKRKPPRATAARFTSETKHKTTPMHTSAKRNETKPKWAKKIQKRRFVLSVIFRF